MKTSNKKSLINENVFGEPLPNWEPSQTIRLRAFECTKVEGSNSDWEIRIPVKPLTEEAHKFIIEFFPNTAIHVERALNIEALIASIVPE